MKYREKRYPCRFPVVFDHYGRTLPATLDNVSYHGAHAILDPRPRLGDWLVFRIINLPIHANVVRFGPHGGIGLRFTRPLSKRQLNMICFERGRRRIQLRELA